MTRPLSDPGTVAPGLTHRLTAEELRIDVQRSSDVLHEAASSKRLTALSSALLRGQLYEVETAQLRNCLQMLSGRTDDPLTWDTHVTSVLVTAPDLQRPDTLIALIHAPNMQGSVTWLGRGLSGLDIFTDRPPGTDGSFPVSPPATLNLVDMNALGLRQRPRYRLDRLQALGKERRPPPGSYILFAGGFSGVLLLILHFTLAAAVPVIALLGSWVITLIIFTGIFFSERHAHLRWTAHLQVLTRDLDEHPEKLLRPDGTTVTPGDTVPSSATPAPTVPPSPPAPDLSILPLTALCARVSRLLPTLTRELGTIQTAVQRPGQQTLETEYADLLRGRLLYPEPQQTLDTDLREQLADLQTRSDQVHQRDLQQRFGHAAEAMQQHRQKRY